MNCCNPTSAAIDCPFLFPNTVTSGFGCRKAVAATYLKAVVAPEPSDPPQPPASPVGSRLFGAFKTLVWVAVSMGIGTLLARVCN